MGHHVLEFTHACHACKATGLYIGVAERDGAAVVCHRCNGSGCARTRFEFDDFEGRRDLDGVTHVVEVNPGICIGRGPRREYALADFGGIPYSAWKRGEPFPPKSENRLFTCPAWWYQSANGDLKPKWKECGYGVFAACEHFTNKDKCWGRFDAEREEAAR